jgi:hypothetical protein
MHSRRVIGLMIHTRLNALLPSHFRRNEVLFSSLPKNPTIRIFPFPWCWPGTFVAGTTYFIANATILKPMTHTIDSSYPHYGTSIPSSSVHLPPFTFWILSVPQYCFTFRQTTWFPPNCRIPQTTLVWQPTARWNTGSSKRCGTRKTTTWSCFKFFYKTRKHAKFIFLPAGTFHTKLEHQGWEHAKLWNNLEYCTVLYF